MYFVKEMKPSREENDRVFEREKNIFSILINLIMWVIVCLKYMVIWSSANSYSVRNKCC